VLSHFCAPMARIIIISFFFVCFVSGIKPQDGGLGVHTNMPLVRACAFRPLKTHGNLIVFCFYVEMNFVDCSVNNNNYYFQSFLI